MVFTPMFPELAHYWDHYCVFIFKEHLVVFPQVRFVKLELLVKKYEHFYSILPNCLCKELGQFLCLLTDSEYSQCVLVNIDHCIFNFNHFSSEQLNSHFLNVPWTIQKTFYFCILIFSLCFCRCLRVSCVKPNDCFVCEKWTGTFS